MKGVTLTNFRRYVKADATKADLRKITDAQVATVYRRFYWDATAGAQLPAASTTPSLISQCTAAQVNVARRTSRNLDPTTSTICTTFAGI